MRYVCAQEEESVGYNQHCCGRQKHGGKFKELHTVGIALSEDEISALCEKGHQWIKNHLGIQELDFERPGNITKDKINKRGYSKFLKINNDISVNASSG